VVVHRAKPTTTPTAARLSLVAREIRMVGLGELLARLERRRQLLAAEGLFAAELKRRCRSCPPDRAGHRAESAAERDVVENARRRWPGVAFEVGVRRDAGPPRRPPR
jgi:exodeoxyribonuclease VII large subunit